MKTNKPFVKLSDDMHLLCETIVMMSADLYNVVYDHSAEYGEACRTIIDLAQEFERELDWKNNCEEKDFLDELDKFERKYLDSIKDE